MLRLLGTVAAGDGSSEPASVSAPRLRILLAILGAHHESPISTDRLIDVLWGDAPPATAPAAIQVGISKLRTIFEPARARRTPSTYLHTDGPNYVLTLPTDRYDVASFVDLADRGRSMDGDDDAASAALDLWAEPPFAEFGDASWALEPSHRLRRLRGAVALDRLARAVRDRAEGPLLDDLTAERQRYPDDERLAGLEMMALYRAGRQDAAVAVYQELRARLRDERGLDPTPELQRLEQAILRHDIGSLERPSPRPHPLRARRGPIFGRDADLDRLESVVADSRFVTVLGPGGVGKTSLVQELVASRPIEPVTWIDLAERPRDASVARAIADELEIEEQPLLTPMEAVGDVLRDHAGLLVLDNGDLVIEGVRDTVTGLLERCPDLAIVLTSRVATALLSETIFAVAPLPLPSPTASADELAENACVQLLRHRGGVGSDALGGPVLTEICTRLDGLPLALELAAFHLRSLSPHDYLAHMADHELAGPGDLPERHRTLDAVISDSVADLDPFGLAVLDAVVVSRGRVTAAFVDRLLAESADHRAILLALADLARRGLLTAHRDGGIDSYSALETVRAHRRRRLAGESRWAELTERHTRAVSVLVAASSSPREAAEIDRSGAEVHEALDRLELAADNPRLHLRLVVDAGTFWYRSGQVNNALDRMRTAYRLHPDASAGSRGAVATAIALMSFSVGANIDMVEWADEALSLFEEIGLPRFPTLEAAQAVAEGRLDAAERHVGRAVDQLDRAAREGVIARDMAANIAWFRGDHDTAAARFLELERAGHAAGERYFVGRGLRGRAVMLALGGAPEAAVALCAEGEDYVDRTQPDRGITQQLVAHAAIALEIGDLERARTEATRALTRCLRQFDAQSVTVAVPIVSHVDLVLGRPQMTARLSGWLRGLCDSTGVYPPLRSRLLLESAESAAAESLGPEAWSAERTGGAADSLGALLASSIASGE